MVPASISPLLAGFGVGIALAGAPGPVQAVLMGESIRGGVGRGFRALAGASLTFGALLMALAAGLSVAPPSGTPLRMLQVAGGAFLVWVAADGLRSTAREQRDARRRALPPEVRGSLAVLLNPGGWLFLGAVASPLFASAGAAGGTLGAVLAAAALMAGLAIGDGAMVLLGGIGVRRGGERVARWVRRVLGVVLGVLGLLLVVDGLTP